MTRFSFAICTVLAFTAFAFAQSVSTGTDEDEAPVDEAPFESAPFDALQLATPPPMLTFVSPDASLVARPDDTPLELPTPTPTPAQRFAIETSAERDTGKLTTEFPANARNIFVRWHGENLRPGALIRVAWVAEDVGDLVNPGFVVDQRETMIETPSFGGRFTISRPPDGWAPGKYRVDLFVDDELKDTLGVTIRD